MGKTLLRAVVTLLFFWLVFGLIGCSSYTAGLRPEYPLDKQIVDTLEPTLSWDDQSNENSTYDVILYERIEEGDTQAYGGEGANRKSAKKKILYLENIDGTSLTLKDVLKPDKTYYWSVRSRNGEVVSDWSKSELQVFTGVSYHRRTSLFEFRSPK